MMRSAKVISILAVVIFAFVWTASEDWQSGVNAINQGNFAIAFHELWPIAHEGDPKAQYFIGLMYFHGRGVRQNLYLASRWFQASAEKGYCRSQKMMGVIYMNGLVCDIDLEAGASWYLRAADQGDPQAQLKMGYLYLRGQGVERNYVLAYKWLSLSVPGIGKDDRLKAKKLLKSMQLIMTSKEIDKARILASRWRETHAEQRRPN